MSSEIYSGSFSVLQKHQYRSLTTLLSILKDQGLRPIRDVVVSSRPSPGELKAETGDFWFHSDGCFLRNPPAVVIIQIIERGDEASVELVDIGPVRDAFPDETYLFGASGRCLPSPIIESIDEKWRVRYRKDYMTAPEGATSLGVAHRVVQRAAQTNAIRIGRLDVDDCLIVNNWTHLHRRSTFRGDRVIRRIWLDEDSARPPARPAIQ